MFFEFRRHYLCVLIDGKRAGFSAVGVMLQNLPQGRTRRDQAVGQVVYLLVAPIRDHQVLVGIEQAEALRHVADRNVEAFIRPL